MEIGLFESYGMDALRNEYRDVEKGVNFLVIDFLVKMNNKKVELIGRTYCGEKGEYDTLSVTVNEITEKDRYKHIEGDAEYVL